MNIIYNNKQLKDVAKEIIANAATKTLCFYGEMGAGKTTLIKAIVTELGGVGETSSPTFGIVNEYQNEKEEVLAYHFDFYRLNDEMEALDIGVEDYFYAEKWVFIEWPEKIPSLLPEDSVVIKITVVNENTRQLEMS